MRLLKHASTLFAALYWMFSPWSGNMACAQQGQDLGSLQGRVSDVSSDSSLSFVRMELKVGDSIWETVTDFDGFYLIRLPYGQARLSVVREAYERYDQDLIILRDRVVSQEVRLVPIAKGY